MKHWRVCCRASRSDASASSWLSNRSIHERSPGTRHVAKTPGATMLCASLYKGDHDAQKYHFYIPREPAPIEGYMESSKRTPRAHAGKGRCQPRHDATVVRAIPQRPNALNTDTILDCAMLLEVTPEEIASDLGERIPSGSSQTQIIEVPIVGSLSGAPLERSPDG